WGTTENNRRARYYRMTAAGRVHLRAEATKWARYADSVGAILAARVAARGASRGGRDISFRIRAGVRRLFRLALHRQDIVHEDIDAELAFHVEARIAQLVARGVPPGEARAEAARRLGDTIETARERLHQSA